MSGAVPSVRGRSAVAQGGRQIRMIRSKYRKGVIAGVGKKSMVRLGLFGLAAVLSASSVASDIFLLGDRNGYGVTRAQGESCFAIAPAWVAAESEKIFAMQPGVYRLPAIVERTYSSEGFSIVRLEVDASPCEPQPWPEGANLDTALGRTGIGELEIGVHDGRAGRMNVWVEAAGPAGYLMISPLRDTDRLMAGMSGSRVLLEDTAAGVLLEVDEANNRGTVIRQDFLTGVIAPFFHSWVDKPRVEPDGIAQDVPTIRYRFFIGKQSWRNNPIIIGTRLFIGSSGRVHDEADVLDGVYSFDLVTGEKMWHVQTDIDFNDLTYIKGLVIGGTETGDVIAVGARSGKTYWKRQFNASVQVRPVAVRDTVAVATSAGELSLLDPKSGSTRANSILGGPVSAGLAAGQGELWVATEAGTLHRFTGFGEVQMRRDSSIYYPDALGSELSGRAFEWYKQLGEGKGLRARVVATPLVLDDRVVLSFVRESRYPYPPVMAFTKNGGLGWVGTDPNRFVGELFGDSHLTPAAWYDKIILADPDSNSIYSISRETGELVWASDLGSPNFQMLSSPVVAGDYIYIATYGGFLHKFSAQNGERVWSMYLGQRDGAGRIFPGGEPMPDFQFDPDYAPNLSSPIVSTPAVSDHTIVVGTEEGFVYVIEDPG
jgi:outer membrane protein assembly factor BamB